MARLLVGRALTAGLYNLRRQKRGHIPQKTEASELFRVTDPSTAMSPPLALLSPILGEHVAIGFKFPVSWTSPSIDRWVNNEQGSRVAEKNT